MTRDDAESGLSFAGFLVFHSPLKEDAIASLKMLADSSHRVSSFVLVLGGEIHNSNSILSSAS